MINFDINKLKTPCFVVDENLIIKNLEILKKVKDETGCHILLAQKAFSMFSVYPTIAKYLDGATASGLFEAKLGFEKMRKENHIFSPAYKEDEFDEVLNICDHIVFNSINQWNKYKDKSIKANVSCGLRINPEFSTQSDHAIYDPCSPFSRLGITKENFILEDLEGIDGLHFHTLCEQNSDDLESTIIAFEQKFGDVIKQMKWINFGGGHHITRNDYDVDRLIRIIKEFKAKYNVEVYLEPGEAIALNAGFAVSEVMDIFENGMNIAILDISAACHMPDVLEMPYTPVIINASSNDDKKYKYRLGSTTCLAGDVIGDYTFDEILKIGDRLVFCDMAIYSMVKTNTFNGINLPSIYLNNSENNLELIKSFGYEDFMSRLS